MKNQFVWLRYYCGYLFYIIQIKCVLVYVGSWFVMNWCFINEEINNFYILLFNVKFFNVWIWGFIYYFFILFGIFVIQIINYVR